MLGKSPVIRYLDAVLKAMAADVRHLDPARMSGTSDDAGHLGAVLADAAGHRVIVAVVAAAHPSAASSRRDRRAENLLRKMIHRAQQISAILGLSWSDVIAEARLQSRRYVNNIGGNVRYQFERGLPADVVQVRWVTARAAIPGAQEAATKELFWSIIGPEFGTESDQVATHEDGSAGEFDDLQALGRPLEDLRAGTATVEDRLEVMGLATAAPQDPWRQIVEGPSFLAYPTLPRSDPQRHYGDEYQLRLASTLDATGPWLPRPILDAVARAQTMRLLFMMESTQLEDRHRLLEVSPDVIDTLADSLYRTSIELLQGGDLPSQMTHEQINDLAVRMTSATYDLLDVRAENPVVDVADHVICGTGALMLFEEVEASLTEPSPRPGYAAFSLAVALHMWIASPFRRAIASLNVSKWEAD